MNVGGAGSRAPCMLAFAGPALPTTRGGVAPDQWGAAQGFGQTTRHWRVEVDNFRAQRAGAGGCFRGRRGGRGARAGAGVGEGEGGQ
eukprot:8310725-Pyramimonas_sp.AAC.1